MTREAVAVENLPGGFSAVYDVLKAMEDAGRIRRGYFVGGLGATQFALPAAVDLLRSVRDEPETRRRGATSPPPTRPTLRRDPQVAQSDAETEKTGPGTAGRGPTRSVGAGVILVDGRLAAYVGRADRQFLTYLPEDEPARSATARAVAGILFGLAPPAGANATAWCIAELDGVEVGRHPLAPFLLEAGFVRRASGLQAAPKTGRSIVASGWWLASVASGQWTADNGRAESSEPRAVRRQP